MFKLEMLSNRIINLPQVGGMLKELPPSMRLVQESPVLWILEEKVCRKEASGNHTYWAPKQRIYLPDCSPLEQTLLQHLWASALGED